MNYNEIKNQVKTKGLGTYLNSLFNDNNINIKDLVNTLDNNINLENKSNLQIKKLLKSRLFLIKRENVITSKDLNDAIKLIEKSSKIVVVSGAGISVNCGIPDFRSKGGLYDSINSLKLTEISDPQEIFSYYVFTNHPKLFYSIVKSILPSNFSPGRAHSFIKALQDNDKLLRNYTQNIDTLERKAGITNLLECHGSFAFLECLRCERIYNSDDFSEMITNGEIPVCTENCKREYKRRRRKRKSDQTSTDTTLDITDEAIINFFDTKNEVIPFLKPTITFFGEDVHPDYEQNVLEDSQIVDLVLVLGTSMAVAPISELLAHIPHKVPVIVINNTPIKAIEPDVFLQGDIDKIVNDISSNLNLNQH
ncbi:DHS-like NAD/FAD-binding domain-containing protein [Wallemia mellicola CBS 633.66]|uniref:DHS-like NAD/FAD-binding domain-containing protein n=1 Tax=Wallemia mellicola (strain ATCC MYA-4683 / CBS 633.66) TaxID=671144 RepID=I4YJB9_WALMC|nr:DHS-like NAD/FAD-binding domain-containing protein [Wallemia mellicola CBS 633.66]EIM24061.1 DHS-like NAD/FAD-binding domain-containing protein [Wallemia mellicola CBS 633.66]|eukprot:XP_006955889.1 DHS-like NAD/FAD-binding domain-containing protein [Wallemia mellicola CBS 633.66]